ncbi:MULTISPECIES: hypothetical protein [unclassified Moorena]|uniref:hypothetical protein n=1 Tax=unclassified Moorena TaxID=2683338 RepID=UPI0013CBEECD|nr:MULTISPECIES: hypothetical protein [unclassified Moorena]NEO20242.1 hypothetical protein [Moorena sp. SIO4A5]NEP22691.1 hypothetical protein [Moorena sp. SIO3I6]NEQ56334.1 hypothetical protein [Moorena sp. SIO4A1]
MGSVWCQLFYLIGYLFDPKFAIPYSLLPTPYSLLPTPCSLYYLLLLLITTYA